jgi:hypothetical protein
MEVAASRIDASGVPTQSIESAKLTPQKSSDLSAILIFRKK